jgi:hypothetical protein
MAKTTHIRLTDQQMECLSAASMDHPIYGENPSHLFSQMPNRARCFSLRTVYCLTKRDYLQDDRKGGYLLTPEGYAALKSGTGF